MIHVVWKMMISQFQLMSMTPFLKFYYGIKIVFIALKSSRHVKGWEALLMSM